MGKDVAVNIAMMQQVVEPGSVAMVTDGCASPLLLPWMWFPRARATVLSLHHQPNQYTRKNSWCHGQDEPQRIKTNTPLVSDWFCVFVSSDTCRRCSSTSGFRLCFLGWYGRSVQLCVSMAALQEVERLPSTGVGLTRNIAAYLTRIWTSSLSRNARAWFSTLYLVILL